MRDRMPCLQGVTFRSMQNPNVIIGMTGEQCRRIEATLSQMDVRKNVQSSAKNVFLSLSLSVARSNDKNLLLIKDDDLPRCQTP